MEQLKASRRILIWKANQDDSEVYVPATPAFAHTLSHNAHDTVAQAHRSLGLIFVVHNSVCGKTTLLSP